jgi:hypothetical protein
MPDTENVGRPEHPGSSAEGGLGPYRLPRKSCLKAKRPLLPCSVKLIRVTYPDHKTGSGYLNFTAATNYSRKEFKHRVVLGCWYEVQENGIHNTLSAKSFRQFFAIPIPDVGCASHWEPVPALLAGGQLQFEPGSFRLRNLHKLHQIRAPSVVAYLLIGR